MQNPFKSSTLYSFPSKLKIFNPYARNNSLWIRQEDENNYAEFQLFAVDEGYLDMQRTVAINDIPSAAVAVEVSYNEVTTTW
jgi:hypothetical protein